MVRQQPKPPNTAEGHEERLRRVVELTQRVLQCDMAQDPSSPTMGMMLYATMQLDRRTGERSLVGLRKGSTGRSALELAAVYARPFTLAREAVYGPAVAESISHFATIPEQQHAAAQIGDMWTKQPFPRAYLSKTVGGVAVTPKGGVDTGTVADRVLYSRLVHADDASAVLKHVTDEDQMWSLAGLVGDWLALISHQEAFISWVRPDICPKTTTWAGNQTTIFKRLGIHPAEDDGDDALAGEEQSNHKLERPDFPAEHSKP